MPYTTGTLVTVEEGFRVRAEPEHEGTKVSEGDMMFVPPSGRNVCYAIQKEGDRLVVEYTHMGQRQTVSLVTFKGRRVKLLWRR